jgi:hypothetical protein
MCVVFQSLWYLSDLIDRTFLCLCVTILLGLWLFTKKRFFQSSKIPTTSQLQMNHLWFKCVCACSTMSLYTRVKHCCHLHTVFRRAPWKLFCSEEELFRSRMFSSCALSMVEPLKEAVLKTSSCLNSTSHGPLILKMPSYRISKGPYWKQFQIGP